ncbi:MAG: hypothetical protein V3U45_03005 [bacterium]
MVRLIHQQVPGIGGLDPVEADRKLERKVDFVEKNQGLPWLARGAGDPAYVEDIDSYFNRLIQGQMRLQSPDYGITRQVVPVSLETLEKAILTTTAGTFNALFSYALISGIVIQANLWSAMPKVAWRTRTLGWRMKTAAAIAAGVGHAEGAAVPADIDPTYQEITPTIKESLEATGISIRMREAESIVDAISENQHVASVAEDVLRAQNADMLAALATVEGDNSEGIRNLLSAFAEIANKTLGAGTIDPWLNIDRDAGAGFSDTNVLFAPVAATDRDLSLNLIDQLQENQEPFWDNPNDNKVYATGYDTHRRWSELEDAKERLGAERFQVSVGGINTVNGQKAGVQLSTYNRFPIIREGQMTSSGTISDLMFMDFDHVAIAQLLPMQTISEDNIFINGTTARTAFYSIQELLMTKFGGNGVLTDLQ